MRQKTLLLTGASRGIGHATVRRFNAERWRVITCSRQPFPAECPWGGGEENHVQVDLSDPTDTINKVGEIQERLDGRLDALVNNAGVSPKGADGARLNTLDTDLMTWGKVFHVNFFASVVLARGLKDELAAAKGSVVNVTSIGAVGCILLLVRPMPHPRRRWLRLRGRWRMTLAPWGCG